MNSAWKMYFTSTLEVTDKRMSLMLSYGTFTNSFTRIVAAIAMTQFEFKLIYLALALSSILVCLSMERFTINYLLAAGYSVVVYVGIGIQTGIFPSLCTKVFGAVVGPKVFPIVFASIMLANAS